MRTKEIIQGYNPELLQVLKEGKLTKAAILKVLSGGLPSITSCHAFDQYKAWLTDNSNSIRTTDNYLVEISAFLREMHLENKPVTCITDKMVNEWINDEASDTKAGTRKVKLAALRNFFWVLSAKGIIRGNPAQLVRVKYHLMNHEQKETKTRVCFTDLEVNRLLDATSLDPFWYHAIIIARYTGLRLGDIAQLEWACFDEPGKMKVWTDKSDTPVLLPLEPIILSTAISLIPRTHKVYCFPTQRKIITDPKRRAIFSVQFQRLCDKLKIKGKSFHCLRHTYATEAKRLGKPLAHIKQDLGHHDQETTQIYVH